MLKISYYKAVLINHNNMVLDLYFVFLMNIKISILSRSCSTWHEKGKAGFQGLLNVQHLFSYESNFSRGLSRDLIFL